GHLPRIRAGWKALGLLERWDVVLYQFVRFLDEGELLGMSKRHGQFIELEAVLNRVGTDVARWFFLQSGADRPLDFDLELAVKQSSENPAYYVQYAHARIASILRTAQERSLTSGGADASLLHEAGEIKVIKLLLRF